MHPTFRFRSASALLALALAAGACNQNTTGRARRHASPLGPSVELDFPKGPITTEASTLHVRGRSNGPRAIADVNVNGVRANSSDGFAHWEQDIALVNGDQSIAVDAADAAGRHAQANADVERVPRVLPHVYDTSSDLTLDSASQRVFFTEPDSTNSLVGASVATIGPAFVSNALDGSGATLSLPLATAFDGAHARVIVWDQTSIGDPRITAIDPATGTGALLSGSSQGSGPALGFTETLAVDSAGATAYLFDQFSAAFYAVDLATGDRTIFSDAGHGSGPMPGFEGNVALDEGGGRLVVTDDANRQILVVDLATGNRSVLSDDSSVGTGPLFVDPKDVAVAPGRHSALVADGSGEILEVDLATGDRTLLSGGSTGAGPAFGQLFRIDVSEALGIAMVFESSNGARLVRVSLSGGDRSDFASDPVEDAGASLDQPADVAVDTARDRILVLESEREALVAIDRTTGAHSTVSGGNPLVGKGPPMDEPRSLAVDAKTDRAYVVNYDGNTTVFVVDLASGDRTILSDDSHGAGASFDLPGGDALDSARGRLLVVDDGDEAILAVNLATGDRTILSDASTGSGPLFQQPLDVVVDDASGRALVSDENAGVFAVDLATGDRTLLSGTGAGGGPAFVKVRQIALDPERGRAIVSDGDHPARLVAVDLVSGERSIFCDDSGAHGEGSTLIDLSGLVLDDLHDLFLACDDERKSIVEIDPVLASRELVSHSSNSAPNGTIAFVSNRDGNDEIYVMNADGSSQKRLTNNVANDDSPAWSPDHKRIAFTSDRDGNQEIYVMNADGTDQKNLTHSAGNDARPSWSPDGSKIAFFSDRDGNLEVYVMNADGSGQTNLTNDGGKDFHPAWSPDGKRIAFVSNRSGNTDIYVMNADGSNVIDLTNAAGVDDKPSWSPDGKKIVFTTNRDGNDEIYVMNADGTGQTNLSNDGDSDIDPSWSTDGTLIAFETARDGNSEIFVMHVDGSGQTDLSNNSADDSDVAF